MEESDGNVSALGLKSKKKYEKISVWVQSFNKFLFCPLKYLKIVDILRNILQFIDSPKFWRFISNKSPKLILNYEIDIKSYEILVDYSMLFLFSC